MPMTMEELKGEEENLPVELTYIIASRNSPRDKFCELLGVGGGAREVGKLPVGHHQDLPDHLTHPLDVPTDSREGQFLAQAHTEGHQDPELLPPSLELSRPLPGSEATISGEALLKKLSGVGFVPLLPAYRRLPWATIPNMGLLALFHSLPNVSIR